VTDIYRQERPGSWAPLYWSREPTEWQLCWPRDDGKNGHADGCGWDPFI